VFFLLDGECYRAPNRIREGNVRIIGTAMLMISALAVSPALAQALPDTTACPEAIAAIATCYAAKQESGAYLLAAMRRIGTATSSSLPMAAPRSPATPPPARATSPDPSA